MRHDDRLNGHWLDCLNEAENPRDEDPNQHGTAMATLLLRLLPAAEVYVARVARDSENLLVAKKNIAEVLLILSFLTVWSLIVRQAILHATQVWDVDIISMSFGFSDEVPSIREAISIAEKVKGNKILFFAAANNDGLNQKEMFPAFSESVISVRGTSHDGAFISQFNPDTWSHNEGTKLYGTISEMVPCDWTAGQLVKSGCSVATPIMAAIAGAIIFYVSCKATSFNIEDVRNLVRTQRGILSVFGVMTEIQGQTRRYLAPWQLFEDGNMSDIRMIYTIGHALSKLPRTR